MWMTMWHIFLAFFRSSMSSYGGGPASIPLMQAEIVNNFKWFTNQQFADALAVGNALPGPIAPKMAAYVGYNVGGVLGAVVGVIATVAPTAILIVVIAKFLLAYKDTLWMQGALKVAKPVVVILLLQTVLDMLNKKTYPTISAYVVSAVAFATLVIFKIHPALIIFGGMIIGAIFYKLF